MPDPLLHVERVSKQFGGVKALDDVSFDVAPGEVLCLAGENGCGKSTLIKIITGVYAPEPGALMRFEGRPIDGLTPGAARDLGIQVIWQDLALFPEMTVAENIGFERNLALTASLFFMTNGITLGNFVMSGLFDRYPNVRVVSTEGGGTTVAIHCDATCTVLQVAQGTPGGHIEGHIVMVGN